MLQVASLFCTEQLSTDDPRSWDVQQLLYFLTTQLFSSDTQQYAGEVKTNVRNFASHYSDQDGKGFRVKKEFRDSYVNFFFLFFLIYRGHDLVFSSLSRAIRQNTDLS